MITHDRAVFPDIRCVHAITVERPFKTRSSPCTSCSGNRQRKDNANDRQFERKATMESDEEKKNHKKSRAGTRDERR